MPDKQPISAVIPTYNGWNLLQQNLPSVATALRNKDEIIIVDDASTDDSFKQAQSEFGLSQASIQEDTYERWQGFISIGTHQVPLIYIKNLENLRFGQSVNRGVAQAQYRLILLLNNDVRPESDLLSHLLPHFQDTQVFAVGCHEIEVNQGGISGGKNKLWFERGMFIHNRADDFESGETAWASGGSSMFDRRKWLELGGFDQAYYPAYWEDVDLSYRARKRGWKVLFDAKAVVYHDHETTNQDVFGQQKIDAMSWKHALVFAWKNGTWQQKIQHMLWQPYWWLKRAQG